MLATDSLEPTLALEARLQAELGATADHREAVQAFLAERPDGSPATAPSPGRDAALMIRG